jgi:hypothetical protein
MDKFAVCSYGTLKAMKKSFFVVVILLLLCIVAYFSFKSNIPYAIDVPAGLTVEKILDPFSDAKNEKLYYISDDKGLFNTEFEINLKLNTKNISQFNSTGYKNMTTITKGDLLAKLSKQIISVYYHKQEWWAFDSMGDTCMAILKDNTEQYYTALIFPPTLCN